MLNDELARADSGALPRFGSPSPVVVEDEEEKFRSASGEVDEFIMILVIP